MEKVELPVHNHALLPFTRFSLGQCKGCWSRGYIYGGYRCNELGCDTLFHKDCAESLPDINHSSHHPDHPLNLVRKFQSSICSLCQVWFGTGYFCSTCDFKLDLGCARRPIPPLTLKNSNTHEHPLVLSNGVGFELAQSARNCKICSSEVLDFEQYYECHQCELFFHVKCTDLSLEGFHTSHLEHPLKFLTGEEAPDYADKKCLLCGMEFNQELHHCDVCNFSICRGCAGNPPPLSVTSRTTHEHQLYLFPRCIDFTCNACGTRGNRSPYLCFQCNFMIHRDCIDLPRVININRHDHRISYNFRMGHGNWTCGVCRQKVDGFYGAYSCSKSSKCSSYVVHSRCATRTDVWDKIELEGTAEEEEITPFEVVDDTTIKHFSHDHYLRLNKDGRILQENKLCEACVFQIYSESFYSCEQCDFVLHERCANISRKKRHVCHNQPFMLHTSPGTKRSRCALCDRKFTGFMYKSASHKVLDVRCGSISEPFEHESHPHPLYYSEETYRYCSAHGGGLNIGMFSCDECDYSLDFNCALLPKIVMNHRYDDHPLFLSYGDLYVNGEYWCEACETKVNPKKWFYTCDDCGVVLHISCVVGDFSYIMPVRVGSVTRSNKEVVPNTSVCRIICSTCNSRCKLPSVLKVSKAGVDSYFCSSSCDTSYILI